MNKLILSILIGLMHILSTQAVNADPLTKFNSAISSPDQAQVQLISHTPPNTTIVGVVPASAFPSCQDAIGGVLYVTRTRPSTIVEHNDRLLDGPTCGTSSSSDTEGTNDGEPLLIVPLTAEGTLSDRPCKVISTPQRYCDIPPGSPLSAFPLV